MLSRRLQPGWLADVRCRPVTILHLHPAFTELIGCSWSHNDLEGLRLKGLRIWDITLLAWLIILNEPRLVRRSNGGIGTLRVLGFVRRVSWTTLTGNNWGRLSSGLIGNPPGLIVVIWRSLGWRLPAWLTGRSLVRR